MSTILSALSGLVGVIANILPVIAGALIGFFGQAYLARRAQQREDTQKEVDAVIAAGAAKRSAGVEHAQSALALAKEVHDSLVRSDEVADWDLRRKGLPDGSVVPPSTRTLAERLGLTPPARLRDIQLIHAGQIPDPDRRDLVERGVIAVRRSIETPSGHEIQLANMRRWALEAVMGVLTTYLAEELVSDANRDAINRVWKMWAPGEASPRAIAAQQIPPEEAG